MTSPGGGVRPRMARPVCDLPEPDSPTMPSRSRPSVKRDAAHRLDDAGAGGKANAQIFDVEERLRHLAAFGSSTSRRPSPSRLKPRLTMKMATPGHGRDPPLVEEEAAAGGDHRAPFRQRRLRAEAEEAEARGGQDDAGHVERHAHDQRGEAERHDVARGRCAAATRPAAAPRRCSRSCGWSASRRARCGHRAARTVMAMAMMAFSMPGPSAATKASARISAGRRGRCR